MLFLRFLDIRTKSFGYLSAVFLLCLAITGCKEDCVDAVDIKSPLKFKISAKPQDDSDYKDLNGRDSKYSWPQVVRWKDTGYVTDGKPLYLRVKGTWSSWSSAEEGKMCGNWVYGERSFNNQKMPCKKVKDNDVFNNDSYSNGKTLYGAPCWFSEGFGLYIMLFDTRKEYLSQRLNLLNSSLPDKKERILELDKEMHPNGTMENMRNPKYPMAHLYTGYSENEAGYSDNEYAKEGFFWGHDWDWKTPDGRTLDRMERGWGVYLKIYDQYYDNNIGEYEVEFKSGVIDETSSEGIIFGPAETYILGKFSNYTKDSFGRLTSAPGYLTLVYGCIVLFIAFTGFGYLSGAASLQAGDVFIRIMKIGIVGAICSGAGWSIYNSYFLSIFTSGMRDFINIIASSVQDGAPDAPTFAFMDEFLWREFLSSVIWNKKLAAILAANPLTGIAYALILITILIVFTFISIQAFAVYLMANIALSLLGSLGPIFMLSILFAPIKNLFDSWVGAMINNAMQAVMMVAFIVFMFTLVKLHFYKIMGFPTCHTPFLVINMCGSIPGCNLDIWTYTPGNISGKKGFKPYSWGANLDSYSEGSGDIYDCRYYINMKKAEIPVPPAFEIKAERHVHLPYLDPELDKEKISDVMHCKLLDLTEAGVMLLIIVLGIQVRNTILSVAQIVAGGETMFRKTLLGAFEGGMLAEGIDKVKHLAQDKFAETLRLDKANYIARKFVTMNDLIGGKDSTVLGAADRKLKSHERYMDSNRHGFRAIIADQLSSANPFRKDNTTDDFMKRTQLRNKDVGSEESFLDRYHADTLTGGKRSKERLLEAAFRDYDPEVPFQDREEDIMEFENYLEDLDNNDLSPDDDDMNGNNYLDYNRETDSNSTSSKEGIDRRKKRRNSGEMSDLFEEADGFFDEGDDLSRDDDDDK